MASAAFFDLDRTLTRRATVLALAGTFRERGVISRWDMLKAAVWQLIFSARGADANAVRRAAEDGMRLLKGFSVDEMRKLVGDSMEPVLRPLVYEEPLELLQQHRERGECCYIVSATLQEIVDHIAEDLGFDGAVGSTCEIRNGIYTGRALRGMHGVEKVAALRELAAQHALDPAESTAYSDSHTDVPFLEAVGHPVAVNPDRQVRRLAALRGWPTLEFTQHGT